KDRKKVMKETGLIQAKTLAMEEEKHEITMAQEEIHRQKEEVELQMKKLEHKKLSGEEDRQMEKLKIQMMELDLKQKELEIEKNNEVLADYDSQFVESATLGNISNLTRLSKFTHLMGVEYINAAYGIAVKEGNTAVITIIEIALDKKK
ncbi:unnamed protein product, partial [Meganyctiphanes norvegica]